MEPTRRIAHALTDFGVSPESEAAFIGKLQMRNGTFKLTYPSRFEAMEAGLEPVFQRQSRMIDSVLDIGVSTGITTIDFAKALERCGITAKIIATDLFIDAYIVEIFRGIRILADPSGWPLWYNLYGYSLRPYVIRRDYFTLTAIPRYVAKFAVGKRLKRMISMGEGKHVQLKTAEIANHKNISMVESDIFVESPSFVKKFDLIRAGNILNLRYFSEEKLIQALLLIRKYLKGPGGMLLVTRTDSAGENSGTLFQLNDNFRFEKVYQIGLGSEIESIALGLDGLPNCEGMPA